MIKTISITVVIDTELSTAELIEKFNATTKQIVAEQTQTTKDKLISLKVNNVNIESTEHAAESQSSI